MLPFLHFFSTADLFETLSTVNGSFTVSNLIYNLNHFTEPHLHLLTLTETWYSTKDVL